MPPKEAAGASKSGSEGPLHNVHNLVSTCPAAKHGVRKPQELRATMNVTLGLNGGSAMT